MTERPILFSGPMVRALLDGTKTQTRRVCKPANEHALSYVVGPFEERGDLTAGRFGDEEGNLTFPCPYGRLGDSLWVRESVADIGARLTYRADTDDGAHCKVKRWTPSIHMPRWASRILLEITNVRVERLQDISEKDAVAEGIARTKAGFWSLYGQRDVDGTFSPRASYRALWESINGAGSWDANPWVWVVEFKKV